MNCVDTSRKESFDVMVVGNFVSGKRTLIHALLGEVALPKRMSALTDNSLTLVYEYGIHTDQVRLYKHNQNKPLILSKERYIEEYTCNPNELTKKDFEQQNAINYIAVESESSVLRNGLRLHLYRLVNREFRRHWPIHIFDAVVIVLDSTHLFSMDEREYLQEYIALMGRGQRNVFFVVNRIDHLSDYPDRLERRIKPFVRTHLEDVFTDSNGRFDEELFSKRVFYTNAYGALCIRTNKPCTMQVGAQYIPVELEMEDTGLLEFENALMDFRAEQQELMHSRERLQRMMQGRRGI